MKPIFSRTAISSLGLGMFAAFVVVAPASASVNTAQCTEHTFSQPFAYVKDNNWYTLPGGESYDNVNGTGWTLSGGASLTSTTLGDGMTGSVLDLPSGATARSPVICVTSEFPDARGEVRNVKGSEGVSFYVEYEGTSTWGHPKNTGEIHGKGTEWMLPSPVNLQPNKVSGLQPMRIVLVGGGTTSRFQVYNLYVDPRMR